MSQKSRTLTLLRRAGREGVTTDRFLEERLPRFSARIFELRREGFFITSELLRGGSMRYTLISEPRSVERDDSTEHAHTHATGEPGPPRPAASTPDAVVSLGAPGSVVGASGPRPALDKALLGGSAGSQGAPAQCLGDDDTPPNTHGQVRRDTAVVVPQDTLFETPAPKPRAHWEESEAA